jgi:acetoin utilization deacetylase AcuC-like enzyme
VNHDSTRTGLYYSHPACLEHDPRLLSPGHPDTPERLVDLERALAGRDWLGWERRPAPQASEAQLELVHMPRHVDAIRELCERGGGAIDPDTFVGPASYRAALHAAGGAVAMTRDLLAGDAQTGFCAVRPSGHHAEPARAMGFCLFDNIAVAAAVAVAELGLERVLILDWDVHAGNGTAEIFRHRSDVLVVSVHEAGLFPGTGALADMGTGEGEGYTINLPVAPRSGEHLWLGLLDEIVLPAARAFAPELVLVSAGFDAHRLDPLANCCLRTESFVRMGARVRELADSLRVPVGIVLEGGYNREVLAECVCATLPALAGAGPAWEDGDAPAAAAPAVDAPEAEQTAAAVAGARARLAAHWPL